MKPDLEAIRSRAEKATAGPWEFRISSGDRWELVMPSAEYGEVQMCDEQFYPWTPTKEDDWKFIAHSRSDITALLAYIDSLGRVREAGKAWVATGPNIDDMETENLYAALAAVGEK